MAWFKKRDKKEKLEKLEKWQFFVTDHKNTGYRINDQCMPLWETPAGLPEYFLGTYNQALEKAKDIKELWREKFGTYPQSLATQPYIHIPEFAAPLSFSEKVL